MIPFESKEIQRSLGHEFEFHYDHPALIPAPRLVSDWKSINSVLRDARSFIVPWEANLGTLRGSHDMIVGTQPEIAKEQALIRTIILGPVDSLQDFSCSVEKKTLEIVRNKSHRYSNHFEIDIVNSVAFTACIESVAQLLGIPLRNLNAHTSLLDTETLKEKLVVLFRYLFTKPNSMQQLALKKCAVEANEELSKAMRDVCEAIECPSFTHILLRQHHTGSSDEVLGEHGDEWLHRLFESGKTVEEVTSLVTLLAVQIAIPSVFAVSTFHTAVFQSC